MTIRAKKSTWGPTYENCAHETRAGWGEPPLPSAQLNSVFVNQPCAVCFLSPLPTPQSAASRLQRDLSSVLFTKHLHGWESYFDEESRISEDILRVGKTIVKPPCTK